MLEDNSLEWWILWLAKWGLGKLPTGRKIALIVLLSYMAASYPTPPGRTLDFSLMEKISPVRCEPTAIWWPMANHTTTSGWSIG